ncbi:MAG: family 78 glycoside hydrolase catalytic domain [Bacteroidota bacterium]|nr:family 78 glycoside hydrolase catalytic domain [Bacteroidota bacterium]
MKKRLLLCFDLLCCFILLLFSTTASGQKSSPAISILPQQLLCERMSEPLGIDVLNPQLSWISTSKQRNQIQTAYHILVASSLNKLNANIGDLWDSKKVESPASLNIAYSGLALTSGKACYWKVKVWDKNGIESSWSKPASWTMGLLNAADWKGKWIGLDKAMGADDINSEFTRLSARMVRKEFSAVKKVKRATAYVCGLGLFELSVNGQKIGDQVLAPALSEYNKRAYYMTFDITRQIQPGKNAVGILLGNGRFFAPRSTVPTKMKRYGFPKAIVQLALEYTDGTTETISSDQSWKITTDGPIIANNEYDGEEYDATKEIQGWNKPGFNDSNWLSAELVEPGSPKLCAQMTEPIKVKETLKPVSVKELTPGVFIFDMGQNMVGWTRLRVKGPKGTTVSLRFAETLQPDGQLYLANIRSAKVTDKYTLKGTGEEVFEPRFTYHGFRFVEVKGYPGKPDLSVLDGRVVYDDMQTTGTFVSSNKTINTIYKNAYWGIRGNYRSMPTDCPQRDERQGWLGDRATGSKGESFIFNNGNLYTKWMQDIDDAQRDDGSVPDVAPSYWPIYSDNVTWPAAYLIISNMVYDQYANLDPIRNHYDSFRKWIMYMKDKYLKNGILIKDTYGDWCMPPESPQLIHSADPSRKTSGEVLSTTYYYNLLTLMQRFAKLLNKPEDANEYRDLASTIYKAYNDKFYNPALKQYANNTATANLLSLAYGLVPDENKQGVFDNIVEKTEKDFNGHISTGLVGAQWIMRMLTQYGRPDLAYKLVTNTDYPSWGYMASQGATTIWELWNGNTADPAMNSGNHVMLLGDLIIWYYENLGGIKGDPEQPGFKHIIMRPLLTGDLNFVNTSHQSPYGLISDEWKKENDIFTMKVEIPVNTTAIIEFPTLKISSITEGGKPIQGIKEIKFVKIADGRAYYLIGSGNYDFKMNL